ncbi:sporulation membrane protein YtaF [Paenibacillus sp. MBLB4367]|uniref:sporulation membrane protein YtaF n=1 Tax=Paenibacillus sp. MBLB4367 TaxID=3384767 RepID=UPI00390820CF
MLPVVSLLILAFAVSLDGFGVGAMYGLRKIKMPALSLMIISLLSGTVIFVSMHIGLVVANLFSPRLASAIGAVILIGIGIWALFQMFMQKDQEAEEPKELPERVAEKAGEFKKLVSIELKRLGLVIQILKTPSVADVDRSGNISASEAMLLGVALSLDAFGAGIGAALIGLTPWLTATIIAAASGTFLWLGLRIGFLYADLHWVRRLSILPGCILIMMGIMKLM